MRRYTESSISVAGWLAFTAISLHAPPHNAAWAAEPTAKSAAERAAERAAAQQAFEERLKDRTPVDLATLAARSVARDFDVSQGAFYDILRLRTLGDASAVPVLRQILERDLVTGRVDGYMAAQALFCIGTPEALKALDDNILTNRYSAQYGIRCTQNDGMDAVKATQFVKRYHLKNLSDDLRLELAVSKREAGEAIELVLTEQNISSKPLRIMKTDLSYFEQFVVQSVATGKFLGERRHPKCDCAESEWVELASDEKWVTKVELPRDDLAQQLWYPSAAVKPGGQARIWVLLEDSALHARRHDTATAKAWIGRAISNPVEITVPTK
jgi:hypothetical protein